MQCWRGLLLFLLSPELLAEYRSVLLRPKLTNLHGLAEVAIDCLLAELTSNAMWRERHNAPPATDRGDDHLWALLDAYSGSLLITGDRLLLDQSPEKSSVISPKAFVDGFLGRDKSAG